MLTLFGYRGEGKLYSQISANTPLRTTNPTFSKFYRDKCEDLTYIMVICLEVK